MDLTHRFTVPTPIEETWPLTQDISSVAECFPGAQVTSAEGDSFSGTVKVKLGPIALVYNGSGTFVEKDEAAHRFVVDAKGKDKRGNGTAGATVTLSMTDAAAGGTDVEVLTDLAITGKPAQFGRGVMQDVSDKLLGQFVACLEERLASGSDPSPGAAPDTASDTASDTAPEERPDGRAGVVRDDETAVMAAPGAQTSPTMPPGSDAAARPRSSGDSLDLGATVLPVLARSYWRQGLAALVVLVLVVRWLRRR